MSNQATAAKTVQPQASQASADAPMPSDSQTPAAYIAKGTAIFSRAKWALFLLGFASFSMIYAVQPLLPYFADSFRISPTQSSLALSLTTGTLAVSILLAGAASQMFGRKGLMGLSMGLAALLTLATAFIPEWHSFLITRALIGFVLGGVPAVAMAWLAEEISPHDLGKAMGLYVAGTAFGAMMGRVGMGLMTEIVSWRFALGVLGSLCLLASMGFWRWLPKSTHFTPQPGWNPRFHLNAWRTHLQNPRLRRVYVIGFLLTSIFVSMFNYASFRLAGPPYHLNASGISLLFLAFGFGMVASSAAGTLTDRYGRKPILMLGFALMLIGGALTLPTSLIWMGIGISLVTIGFFITHAAASTSVGPLAGQAKGHASSLYLVFYYIGSSITGSLSGTFWEQGGWPAIVTLSGLLAMLGLWLASHVPATTTNT